MRIGPKKLVFSQKSVARLVDSENWSKIFFFTKIFKNNTPTKRVARLVDRGNLSKIITFFYNTPKNKEKEKKNTITRPHTKSVA